MKLSQKVKNKEMVAAYRFWTFFSKNILKKSTQWSLCDLHHLLSFNFFFFNKLASLTGFRFGQEKLASELFLTHVLQFTKLTVHSSLMGYAGQALTLATSHLCSSVSWPWFEWLFLSFDFLYIVILNLPPTLWDWIKNCSNAFICALWLPFNISFHWLFWLVVSIVDSCIIPKQKEIIGFLVLFLYLQS